MLITESEAGEGAEVCVILQNSVFIEKNTTCCALRVPLHVTPMPSCISQGAPDGLAADWSILALVSFPGQLYLSPEESMILSLETPLPSPCPRVKSGLSLAPAHPCNLTSAFFFFFF